MKRTAISMSLIFLFIVLSNQVFCQKTKMPGAIITNENERIEGFIKQQSDAKNMQECIFFKEGNMVRYAPGEIQAYIIGDERIFESKVITFGTETDIAVFAQCIVKGVISMYQYIDQDRKRHYYLQKGDDFQKIDLDKFQYTGRETATELNRFRGILNLFFEDCGEIYDEVQSVKPRNSDIADLTIQYNQCKENGSRFILDVAQKYRKGLIFGYRFGNSFPVEFHENIVSYGVANITFTSIDPSNEFDIGWFFELYPGPKRNLSIIPCFIYTHSSVEVPFEQFPPEYYESPGGSKSVGYSYIRIPVSFRYTYNKIKFKPFAEAGMFYSFPPTIEGFRVTEKVSDFTIPPDIPYSSLHVIRMYDYSYWGFNIGGGIQIPVTEKISFDIGAKYRISKPIGAVVYNSSTFSSVTLFLGFGF